MGGYNYLSAWYAIISCAFNEFQFINVFNYTTSRIFCCNARFMDDLISIIAFDKRSPSDYQQAVQYLYSLLTSCYDQQLVLELTSNSDGTDRQLTYLNYIITLPSVSDNTCASITNRVSTSSSILLSPYIKNVDSVRINHTQTIFKFQHYHSYSAPSVKLGVIKSTVLTYYRTSNNPISFLYSIIHLYHELQLLSYPPYLLLNTIKSCYYMYQNNIFTHC